MNEPTKLTPQERGRKAGKARFKNEEEKMKHVRLMVKARIRKSAIKEELFKKYEKMQESIIAS